jgi:hypothetical protein
VSRVAAVQKKKKLKSVQFALVKQKLPGKGFRLLYTWSRDGRSAHSFHQRCDNQVCRNPSRAMLII